MDDVDFLSDLNLAVKISPSCLNWLFCAVVFEAVVGKYRTGPEKFSHATDLGRNVFCYNLQSGAS